MSVNRRIAFAVFASGLSRAVGLASTLVVLPLLFRMMDREELGLWMLLVNSQAFLGLLGFGIGPTLTRHIALARGRGQTEAGGHLAPDAEREVADLVATGRWMLRAAALVVFPVALGAGALMLRGIELTSVGPSTVLLAWCLLALGYSLGVWNSYFDCWLAGIGYVGLTALWGMGFALAGGVATVLVVSQGGGLVGLACLAVAGGLVQRVVMRRVVAAKVDAAAAAEGRATWETAGRLAPSSARVWLTGLGGFMILQTDSYFIAAFRSTAELPAYQGGYALVRNVYDLAVMATGSSAVFLSQAWQAGRYDDVRRLTLRCAQVGLAVMGAGVGFSLVAGRELTEVWLGPGNFIGYPILAVFAVMLTLEAQHVILTTCSRSTEDERYVWSSLGSGVLNLILTWLLVRKYGSAGVAVGTMTAQMLTNNWYAVYRPLVRLEIPFRNYAGTALTVWAATFVGTGLASSAARYLVTGGGGGRLAGALAAAAAAGWVLLSVLWWGVLDRPGRGAVLSRVPVGGLRSAGGGRRAG